MYNEIISSTCVVVTDFLKANTGEDLSDIIQEVIIKNPNRVIFFPDGKFCSIIKNTKVTFRDDADNTNFLIVDKPSGNGLIESPFFDESKSIDKSYKDYLSDRVI